MPALVEARESLTYWESRLQKLPRRAVRKRREAREMAARWRDRVMESERAEYGPGILGAIFLLMSERRLPTHTSRQLVRVGRGAVLAVAATAASLVLLACVLFVAIVAAIF